jgi:uncharacterized protein
LCERTLGLLRSVLNKHTGIQRAIVYDSRAKGNCRPGSDIELTLDAPALTFTDLLRINNELDDLMLPYTIDLSLLWQIDNSSLRGHIERVGRLL